MSERKKFSLAGLVSSALIVGFVGFAAGFNYPVLQRTLSDLISDDPVSTLPEDLDYTDVEQVYDLLRANFAGSLEAEKLLEGAKKGLVAASGDPNTTYLSAEEAQEFQSDLQGTFSGIGAEIAIKNDRLVIVAPLSGTPADEAGLRAGDRIVAIDGQDTSEMSVDKAVSHIRGEAGTTVKLTIIRGNRPAKDFEIKRAQIEVPAVNSQLLVGSIGYIELVRFDESSAAEVIGAVSRLKSKGAKGFILDVRNNPGGLLQAAVDIADEALPVGQTIVEERKDGELLRTFKSTDGGVLVGEELVVLINEGSASASEIIAGALKENDTATVIGETSFGKGSVQELIDIDGQDAFLKVTIARWYTPEGNNIGESGIEPDVKVERTIEDFDKDRDPQLRRALDFLKQ